MPVAHAMHLPVVAEVPVLLLVGEHDDVMWYQVCTVQAFSSAKVLFDFVLV